MRCASSTALTRLLPTLLGTCLAAATLPCQGMVQRSAPRPVQHLAAFDGARERLVLGTAQGDTVEFDGSRWLRRPGLLPLVGGGMVYRTQARRLCAIGVTAALTGLMLESDGVTWQVLTPPLLPSPRTNFSIAYDLLRDRVVLFGGIPLFGGMVTDTWEWDGAAWHQRTPATVPPWRRDAPMAFEPARGVCVMFGGLGSNGTYLNETWEWDGSDWRLRAVPLAPPARYAAGLTHDPGRNRTVLFGGWSSGGGLLGDLWEYDGNRWQQVPTTGGPGPRAEHDLVFDSRAGEALLVGGDDPLAATDAWSWNGQRWLALPARGRPGPRALFTNAAPDPVGGGILMFGGSLSDQTSRFVNGQWQELNLVPRPSLRSSASMWSDGSAVWLFGGFHTLGGYSYQDLWRWNGSAWQSVFIPLPPARSSAGIAFDAGRGRAVLFGGQGGSFGLRNDTWTFDGIAWRQETPGTMPSPRATCGMAHDPPRQRVVLFGGTGPAGVARNDTWAWDGATWTAVNTPLAPPALGRAALHFDARIQRIVLTQCQPTQTINPSRLEAWTLDGAIWQPLPLAEPALAFQHHALLAVPGGSELFLVDGNAVLELSHQPARAAAYGLACAGAPLLTTRDRATPGNGAFGLDVVDAPSRRPVAVLAATSAVDLPLGPCRLLVAPGETTLLAFANGAGFATLDLPIPANAALIGSPWHCQALVLLPAAPAGFAASAGLRVVVGG